MRNGAIEVDLQAGNAYILSAFRTGNQIEFHGTIETVPSLGLNALGGPFLV